MPSLNKFLVLELAHCEWIDKRESVIALGPSGVGKTHTALALISLAMELQERPTVDFSVVPVAGAQGYRAQIATDTDLHNIISEAETYSSDLKIDGLQDGNYFAHITVLDEFWLQGIPQTTAFKLKARPEPQLTADKLAPGNYFWRVATIVEQADGSDQGSYDDPQSFVLLPTVQLPKIADVVDGDLSFRWPTEPPQKFVVEIGRDASFSPFLLTQETSTP